MVGKKDTWNDWVLRQWFEEEKTTQQKTPDTWLTTDKLTKKNKRARIMGFTFGGKGWNWDSLRSEGATANQRPTADSEQGRVVGEEQREGGALCQNDTHKVEHTLRPDGAEVRGACWRGETENEPINPAVSIKRKADKSQEHLEAWPPPPPSPPAPTKTQKHTEEV